MSHPLTTTMTESLGHKETDILILGATGFTGKLITHYLSTHQQRTQFTLGIGGRSVVKLEKLLTDLNLNRDLRVVQVDLKDESALENVVQSARVIINAIGPYFLSGTPIVRFCARNGVHYLDLSGETHWHQHLIKAHDYTASRSGAVIVPSCAFNSAPADMCVYLAAKALQDISPPLLPGKSTTVYDFKGGYSGGTAATTISTFGNVDHEVLHRTMEPYTLSPIVGNQPSMGFEFVSKLSIPKQFGGQTYHGYFSTMASINTAVVQRTFGLLEMIHTEHHGSFFVHSVCSCLIIHLLFVGNHEEESIRYGPDFIYSEFLLARNPITAFFSSLSLAFAFVCLLLKPVSSPLFLSFSLKLTSVTNTQLRPGTSSPNSSPNQVTAPLNQPFKKDIL